MAPAGTHLTITACRKLQDKVYIRTNIISTVIIILFFLHFNNLEREGPNRTRGADKHDFSVSWSSPVEQYLNSVGLMGNTYQFLPRLSQSTSRVYGMTRFLSCFIFSAIPKVVHLPQLSQSTSRFPLPGMTPSLLAIVGVYSIFLTLSDRMKDVSIVNTKHNGWIFTRYPVNTSENGNFNRGHKSILIPCLKN